jgi:hypothetical protein
LTRVRDHRDMDTNVYALEAHVRERLTDARARAARRASLPRSRRRPLRAVVGAALIAVGTWLVALEPATGGTRA